MKSFPVKTMDLEQATSLQFKIVDEITKEFNGYEILSRGDLGVNHLENKPLFTSKVENVIAKIFDTEAALLVRGSGTVAIRSAMYSVFKGTKRRILVHEAPIYPTTLTSIDMMNLQVFKVDFNDLNILEENLRNNDYDGCIIQHTRQNPSDSYDYSSVISILKKYNIPVICDDNYAALKTSHIGTQYGGDLSCFSTFKLLGPQGVGCIVGSSEYISKIKSNNYSGGLQVQGFEAIEVLQGMIYAPVSLAIASKQCDLICNRLNSGEVTGVINAQIVNAQSKVVIVTLDRNAKQIIEKAVTLGAAPHPIGSESKYEFVPLFYRLSSTFRDSIEFSENMIRINPMRCGADTVIRILKESIECE